jgi:uncharacterized protein with von Willebrand factor type A (vWA) domain
VGNARDFIEQWLDGGMSRKKVEKLKTRWSVEHDRFDRKALDQVTDAVPEFQVNARQLSRVAPESGETLFGDAFHALYKAIVKQNPLDGMRATHLVNHAVMEQVLGGGEDGGLPEYEKLWRLTASDKVGAAQADIKLRPTLEEILDRLRDEQNLANSLQQQMDEHDDLAAAMLELLGGGGSSGEGEGGDGEGGDGEGQVVPGSGDGEGLSEEELQQQIEKIQQQIRELEQRMVETADQLDKGLEESQADMRLALGQGLDEAAAEINAQEDASMMFGEDPGALRHLDPEKRIQIAKSMDSQKFRQIAKLLGKMLPRAMGEQCKKVERVPEEIVNITTGNDLSRVLPMELIDMVNPVTRILALKRYRDREMIQYKMQGTERLAQGDIIVCEDGSGSMSGAREIFAKALSITLMKIAREQGRAFNGIHFGNSDELTMFEFENKNGAWAADSKVKRTTVGRYASRYPDIEMDYIEGVINFAELFYGGGPLRVDQRVVTAEGWMPIGDVKVGDQVYAKDGTLANVTGVYPQGELDLYEVTFKDGATVICDGTHIWNVSEMGGEFHDTTLNEMLGKGFIYTHRQGQRFRFSVPMAEPVQLPVADLPIDPYLLGYLLGDGSLGGRGSALVHSSEEELPWQDCLPSGVSVSIYREASPARCASYGLVGPGKGHKNPLLESLESLGLKGVRGADKFVPDSYLWSSVGQRHDLLSGLLDSDGSTVGHGGFEFSNISKDLCEAVIHLTQSLGGVASLKERKVRDNEKPGWRVRGRLPVGMPIPFRLTRKRESYVGMQHQYTRSIVSAKRVDRAQAVCIKIDRADGLFLTEGFVVTHNTDFQTPLSKALEVLQAQHDKYGATRGDIVFITDGICQVSPEFMKHFLAERDRLDFRVWGMVIGATVGEPLTTLCNGDTFQLTDLTDGSEIDTLFQRM